MNREYDSSDPIAVVATTAEKVIGIGKIGDGDIDEDNTSENIKSNMGKWDTFRQDAFELTQTPAFNIIILLVILANSVTLAMQTSLSLTKTYGYYFDLLDSVFLGVYLYECILKLYAWRWEYFKSGWNCFDFFIVFSSVIAWILPEVINVSLGDSFDSKIFRLLRLFRAVRAIRSLRVIRTISFLRSLQVIVSTVIKSIPAVANIVMLIMLAMYIYAVIGTSSFREYDQRRFGSIGQTLFRLFQLLTFDSWTAFYHDNPDAPGIYFFILTFIILENFILLNLLTAVIVNNLQSSRERSQRTAREEKRKKEEQEKNALNFLNETSAEASRDLLNDTQLNSVDNILEEDSGLDNYYSPNLPERQKELLSNYFRLMASLEFNMSNYEEQQKVLDDLVEVMKDGMDKDDG